MDEFEQSSEVCNQDWSSSSVVRCLESGMVHGNGREYVHIQGSLISEGWVGRFGSGNGVRLLARTPPFPIQRVGTCLELLHS